MVLSSKFNDYFKTNPVGELMLGLYSSSTYGSNAFDFAQAARIAAPVNDHAVENTCEVLKKTQFIP